MFSLDPLKLGPEDAGNLLHLEAVRPRFHLPNLEECGSSVDRLLDGLHLRTTLTAPSNTRTARSPKGKGREVTVETELDDVEILEADQASFWLEAGENQAGPSTGKVFKVSSRSFAVDSLHVGAEVMGHCHQRCERSRAAYALRRLALHVRRSDKQQ